MAASLMLSSAELTMLTSDSDERRAAGIHEPSCSTGRLARKSGVVMVSGDASVLWALASP